MDLNFESVSHDYAATRALDMVSLTAHSGEITCLLGPSGCGKTTLLKLAAGLQAVQSGSIRLDRRLLADSACTPPPEQRPIGLVFQEGALFPHMTVAENIGFGLAADAAHDGLVNLWLERIGMPDLGPRYPHMLSGGQQQRVALARAMAPEPAVLLMDEPFANIDVVLRRELREEARLLLKERAATAILVTHDPQEAMELGDAIAVMDRGRIAQFGTPDALFDSPASPAIGALIGGGQRIAAQIANGMICTPFGDWPLSVLRGAHPRADAIELLAQPSAFVVTPVNDMQDNTCIISDIRRLSNHRRITLTGKDNAVISLETPLGQVLAPGQHCRITPQEHTLFAFPSTA